MPKRRRRELSLFALVVELVSAADLEYVAEWRYIDAVSAPDAGASVRPQ